MPIRVSVFRSSPDISNSSVFIQPHDPEAPQLVLTPKEARELAWALIEEADAAEAPVQP